MSRRRYIKSRREGLNRLKLTGCMLTMCVIVFCVTGILLNYQLGKDKDWDTSQWYQIFYGAYILIILCVSYIVIILCILNLDKQGRHEIINKMIQKVCFLFLITVIAFGASSAFFGGFVEVSGVLKNNCTNITDGVSLTFSGDLCLTKYQAPVIAFIVFYSIFILAMCCCYCDRSNENESLIRKGIKPPSINTVIPLQVQPEPRTSNERTPNMSNEIISQGQNQTTQQSSAPHAWENPGSDISRDRLNDKSTRLPPLIPIYTTAQYSVNQGQSTMANIRIPLEPPPSYDTVVQDTHV